jgi:small subunit ribosomal protein S8
MTMSDPIADLLTRIRNAYAAGHETVKIPFSKIKWGISEVLKKEGYIRDAERVEEGARGAISIRLKYPRAGKKMFRELKRVSRPGRRVYVKGDAIRKVKGGLGVAIISTSRGVMSDRIARKQGVGGELLCTVW